MVTATADGKEYSASAFLVVPDPEKPSTWKLRIEETPGNVTVPQLGRAAAALGPGFRGQKVQLSPEDRKAAARKLISRYHGMDVADDAIPDYLWGMAGMSAPTEKADYSREYLQSFIDRVKAYVPKWLLQDLHSEAFHLAGGRARHREKGDAPIPTLTLALRHIQPAMLANATDEQLKDAWASLEAWHASTKRRGGDGEPPEEMASWLQRELKRRNLDESCKGELLAAAKERAAALDAALADMAKGVRLVPGRGAVGGIAFVGSVPTEVDSIRGEPLVGLDGATFRDAYLAPVGLRKQDVFITHLVPVSLGHMPTQDEVDQWHPHLLKELLGAKPRLIVALGRQAADALEGNVDLMLPHPRQVRHSGDNGEVKRKLARLRMLAKSDIEPSQDWVLFIKAQALVEELAPDPEAWVQFCKADAEKQIVYGIVSEPGVEDAQGDVLDPETIEQACHDYMVKSQMVGADHKSVAPAKVVENYIAPTAFKMGDEQVRKGSWVLAVQVVDKAAWQKVKDGDWTGFSLGGYGRRQEMP